MELKVYDKIEWGNDSTAKVVFDEFLEESFSNDAICYYKEPVYENSGGIRPTFTIVDKDKGIFSILILDYSNETLNEINENYWMINNKKTSNKILDFDEYTYKFKSEINMPKLKMKRHLEVNQCIILPNFDVSNFEFNSSNEKFHVFGEDFRSKKNSFTEQVDLSGEQIKKIESIIQKSDILKSQKEYFVEEPVENMRDAIAFNNQKINIFDEEQLKASLSISGESEKIRGLAGTGKTVILAIKAARLHYKYPDKKILVTFSTHSLYNQIINLTRKYYYKLTGKYPDQNLSIMHAWGGKTVGTGVYYNACVRNGLKPLTLRDAKNAKTSRLALDYVCTKILDEELREEYDFILLDEAQDMPKSFFQLLEKISIKPANIIYAYDELQNINNVTLEEPEDLFGKKTNGEPRIKINAENDHILKRTYRNHKKVLLTAIGFGFGFYSNNGLVQLLNDKSTWEALGFTIQGTLFENTQVTVSRSKYNSPNDLDEVYKEQPIVNFQRQENSDEEIKYVVKEIKRLIEVEKVRPEDIMIISLSKESTEFLKQVQYSLYDEKISTTIPGVVDGARDFVMEGSITLTTVRKAKGNEVPIVFVMNLQTIYNGTSQLLRRNLRNQAFISMTRAKAWLYLTGSGKNSNLLEEEFNLIHDDLIKFNSLKFNYPSEEEIKDIERINILVNDKDKSEAMGSGVSFINKLIEEGDLELLTAMLDDDAKQKLINELNRRKETDE